MPGFLLSIMRVLVDFPFITIIEYFNCFFVHNIPLYVSRDAQLLLIDSLILLHLSF